MKQKTFNLLVGVIFLLIALLHVIRLLWRWEAVIGGWEVPMGLSWVALVVSGYLIYSAFRLSGEK